MPQNVTGCSSALSPAFAIGAAQLGSALPSEGSWQGSRRVLLPQHPLPFAEDTAIAGAELGHAPSLGSDHPIAPTSHCKASLQPPETRCSLSPPEISPPPRFLQAQGHQPPPPKKGIPPPPQPLLTAPDMLRGHEAVLCCR